MKKKHMAAAAAVYFVTRGGVVLGDPAFNGKLYDGLNGKPVDLSVFDLGNAQRAYYQDTNGAWWLIQGEFQNAATSVKHDQWRVTLALNTRANGTPIYTTSTGKAFQPGFAAGLFSSPQNAVDGIDEQAIRMRSRPSSRFPWWLVVVGALAYKRRRR